MTPAEQKARELVEKFSIYAESCFNGGTNLDLLTYNAKQCALIHVEELMEEVRDYCDDNHHQDRMNFYINVRTAIEQMP